MANTYCYLLQYKKAIAINKECIKVAKLMNFPKTELSFLYCNIGLNLIFEGLYEEALEYLNMAKNIDEKNQNLIMHFIYAYYFLGDKDNLRKWLQNALWHIQSDKSIKYELDFWSSVLKNKSELPSEKMVEKAILVYERYKKQKKYIDMYFYLEIVIDLLERRKDIDKAFQYIKEENYFLKHLSNS